jgi:signal transduction histidine kinase/ActR/RegA family two-component response regulator
MQQSNLAADASVRAGLMDAWHRHEPMVIFASIVTSILFVVSMYPHRPRAWLLTWLGVKLCVMAIHIFRVSRVRPEKIPPEEITRWERELMFSSIVVGATWGVCGLVFFTPDQVLVVLFITFVLFGISGGLVASMAAYWPAYPPFAILAICPLAYSCFAAGGDLYLTMGVLALLYMASNIFFSRASYRALRASVELRFANLALIAELQEEKDRVIAADRAKTKFLAAASHDLRQPIHALGMFASTLATIATQPQPKIPLMQEITRKLQLSVRGLSSLLNTLLDISKLDAGVIETHPQALSLQNLLDSVEGEFSEHATQKSITLTVLPSRATVVSDPVLLKQILNNLVSNAIRYTANGRVVVGVRRRGGYCEIQVWDTGQGIALEQQEIIFGEFIQLHNPHRDREQGLGLGLSIVKRTAELLGHTIRLRSVVGRGSVFSVTLPLAVPISSSPPIATPPAPLSPLSPIAPTSHAPTHTDLQSVVIVIDDDKDVLTAMRLLVSSWGFEVIAAQSADAAIAALNTASAKTQRNVIHIFSDYRLANRLNGADAIRDVLNKLGRDIPATIITGDTSPDRIREAANCGFTVLHKPLASEALRAIIIGKDMKIGD